MIKDIVIEKKVGQDLHEDDEAFEAYARPNKGVFDLLTWG
jgi:hypothetical protein